MSVLALLLCCLTGCVTNATHQIFNNPKLMARMAGDIERRPEEINDHWRFFKGDDPAASAMEFDASSWQLISLPHTWNVADGRDGGNDYYRGPGWYRRMLRIDESDVKADKCFYLRFGAASLVADVYVNGTHVGQHRGGFAAFCFDVTDQVHAGENIVSVRVDNTRVDDVAPLSGDFTVFGGLYRGVELLVLNRVHISPIDDGSSGVYARLVEMKGNAATIEVTTKVRNTSGWDCPDAEIWSFVVPAGGTEDEPLRKLKAGTFDPDVHMKKFVVAARSDATVVLRYTIPKARLWQCVENPAGYGLYVAVTRKRGGAPDLLLQPFGVRTIKIDPDGGLLLNGKPYAAHGVNTHQEVPDKGWAGSADDYALSYKLVRELGATCVRMAHYQHNEIEYSLCDQMGLIVWTEIPLVNDFGKSPAFADNAKQQLRELIKQNFNHPSVLWWGLWNELAAGPEDPNWQLVRELNELAHELDPSRPTTAAHHRDPKFSVVNIPDVIAFNRYPGWYGGRAEDWGKLLDELRSATPGRPIAMSEYGAGASVNQHELNPARVQPGGPWHPEEYQSFVHEQAWMAMKARPYLWGTFVWNMFDFSADQRKEGDHAGRNDKGLVTIDHKTKKDAFYFYQANWTTEPMVHITSARYDPYPIGKSSVKVYSNCDEVELFAEGKSLGKQTGNDGIFVWPDVEFVAGPSTVTARGTKGGIVVEDVVKRTVSKDASTRTTPPATKPATSRVAK